jgi:hypothetical protein
MCAILSVLQSAPTILVPFEPHNISKSCFNVVIKSLEPNNLNLSLAATY